MSASSAPLLRLEDVEVVYDRVVLGLREVTLDVPPGGVVALLGANGAGKSTTLKAVSNLLGAERGRVTRGSILLEGERVDGLDPAELVRRGVVQVMEGRRMFEPLTVEENLRVGAYARRDRVGIGRDLDLVYALFPRLRERRYVKAGFLSGGEQQMTAVGRAMMARPTLMLLDEPSMGLAPMLVREVYDTVGRLNREQGIAVLLAEQNVRMALKIADHGYVLENGRVVLDGPASRLGAEHDIKEFYLGLGSSADAHPSP